MRPRVVPKLRFWTIRTGTNEDASRLTTNVERFAPLNATNLFGYATRAAARSTSTQASTSTPTRRCIPPWTSSQADLTPLGPVNPNDNSTTGTGPTPTDSCCARRNQISRSELG
ncbi:hypothetical protein CC1G_09538 [Coprinopsis cinerea okayama7|uniref:Uncharacterized protein n=1 Tax=Coprinopsis cinerea (strain Okayama-7 / 130 / ATCC MYA-4618 / FGSC 9003) TaxID=240176 RepID=A8P0X2_COPC7|nr:hypothetical protein CC1G_09538 [Coprinopsis cinerea okayama7\|eukprot:XP_001837987.1 hypothetical protein CC1G_09538 [Coprinopsis cinerea okayama7\